MTTAGPTLRDRLLDRAREATGLDDFGSDSYREGLDIVCDGLARPHVRRGGAHQLGNEIVSYLSNRLRVTNFLHNHPALVESAVEAPIVILGLPRTGTTAVSYLLDADPQFRCLLNWEAVQSVPPPTDETLRSDPRCVEMMDFQHAILADIDPPPPHWEWADGPTECTFAMAQDFKTVMWESRLPNPDYRDFISTCDMSSAYRYHRRVLQVLGSQTSGTWCLKMPAHAYFIDALLDEYPDARIVWTHRDPAAATESFLNLAAFAHKLTLGEPDIDWIVETYPPRLVEQAERPMRALAGRDVYHLHYDVMMRDQVAEMGLLYEWLGTDLTDATSTSMAEWLQADTLHVSRAKKAGLAEFGLSRDEVLDPFADYINTFNIQLDQ